MTNWVKDKKVPPQLKVFIITSWSNKIHFGAITKVMNWKSPARLVPSWEIIDNQSRLQGEKSGDPSDFAGANATNHYIGAVRWWQGSSSGVIEPGYAAGVIPCR